MLDVEERNSQSIQASNSFWRMKFFAILFVVCAHCVYSDYTANIVSKLIGLIGVPIFLLISGLFFTPSNTLSEFLKKQMRNLIIPWFLWGVITYIASFFSSNTPLTFLGLLMWLVGLRSWLYFVPVLFLCKLFFQILGCKRTGRILVVFLFSVVSNLLTIIGVFKHLSFFTQYQNPFNWVLFFCLGILVSNVGIRRFEFDKSFFYYSIFFFLLTLIIGVLLTKTVNNPSYWAWWSIGWELIASVSCFFSASVLEEMRVLNITVLIGKQTYFVFFVHMQLGMFIANSLIKVMPFTIPVIILMLFKPVFIVFISYAISQLFNLIFNLLHLEKYKCFFAL